MERQDSYDVVVLGTGAAGLTAALAAHGQGASVAVFEKAERVGGTAAWSGGMVWIPLNDHMAAAGIPDSREEALEYLRSIAMGIAEDELLEAYVDHGAEAMRWLEAETPLELYILDGFPDYQPEKPGAKPGGGRSLECPLFAYTELGDWAERVTVGHQMDIRSVMDESRLGNRGRISPEERERRVAEDVRGSGQALVGRLLKGCLDRGIEPSTNCRAVELVLDGRRVTGVRLEGPEGPFEVAVRGGVILATGGFEWDPNLRRSFLRGPLTSPVSVPTNTGDALRMAIGAGADLAVMKEAWWYPVVDIPDGRGGTLRYSVMTHVGWPRAIMVNRAGERFTNESLNYNALGAAFHQIDPSVQEYVNLPAWVVFDAGHFERYGFLTVPPGSEAPDWIPSGATPEELAERIGVPGDALRRTLEVWSRNAREGVDPAFHRGESVHDRWWGDPARRGGGAAAAIGPIDTPPYYAVEVRSGALGTKGGPRTDANGQVRHVDGGRIEGLFAAGNAMAAPLGHGYGGAGGTLGPGMVFGFLAGREAGRRAVASASRDVAGAVS